MQKRIFLFALIAMALVVAIPIAAGPPGPRPAVEGVISSCIPIAQEVMLRMVDPGCLLSAQDSNALPIRPIFNVSIANVATLAGLMRGAATRSVSDFAEDHRLGFDPRDRMKPLARDQTAAFTS